MSETFAGTLLEAVAQGRYHDPHAVLGLHPLSPTTAVVRTLRPLANRVTALLAGDRTVELTHEYDGVWVGLVPADTADYRIRAHYADGTEWTADDPYRLPPMVGELDLHLIAEGRHEELWRVLGAHPRTPGSVHPTDVAGVVFTVWAPHARAVRVIGDFNRWDGRGHAMRSMGGSGVWELCIPGLPLGATYKYEILTAANTWVERADPLAQYAEVAPATASRVTASTHAWQDAAWMEARAAGNPHHEPMSVYEVHLGSWKPGRGYRDIADELIEYVQWLGYTHVEFLPLAEHPFGGSWGYQVTGYFAATSRFGTPDDLRYLIDRLHQANIGVIMDWVPGHFPKDEWALARFDGEPLYEYADPRRGEHPDWGTLVFDYGNPRVRNFLVANALFWLEEFHIDGLRVDAVASMLYLDYSRNHGEWAPNIYGGREHLEAVGFLQETTATAYKRNPGIVMIAEESTAWPGVTADTTYSGLGFGYKWNMGWMHDTLQYLARDPAHRSYHHNELTFSFIYAFSEHYVLPISHDEVVHGKGSLYQKFPGDDWKKRATLRAYLAFMWGHPGKKLLFMGQEFGQRSEWNPDESLAWDTLNDPSHHQLAEFVGALNRAYRDHSALWDLDDDPAGFHLLDGGAAVENVLAFLRTDRAGRPLACLANFAGHPHEVFRVGLPQGGRWREVLNSDAHDFGGSGVGNCGMVTAEPVPHFGCPFSALVTLPPLGTIWLSPDEQAPATPASAPDPTL